MSADDLRLSDLGEFRLIEEIILPLTQELGLGSGAGDDCAYVPGSSTLAVSADVGPTPLLHSLPGYGGDFEARGWLAVVATASDIATAGATPLFLTNCVDAPADMKVRDFRDVMTGVFRACAAFGFANGGGDVRHGSSLQIRTFGAGAPVSGLRLGRSGAVPGDHLVLIGPPPGTLMATYLLARAGDESVVKEGCLLPEAEAILRFPRGQIDSMRALAEAGLLTAASDTSDGVLGAIENIARASSCGAELALTRDMLPPPVERAASAAGCEPWNIFFAWGDWSVVVAVNSERRSAFDAFCVARGILQTPLGTVTSTPQRFTARRDGGAPEQMATVRNENFAAAGFNARLEDHLNYLLRTPLFKAGFA